MNACVIQELFRCSFAERSYGSQGSAEHGIELEAATRRLYAPVVLLSAELGDMTFEPLLLFRVWLYNVTR
jgi:hypothetical protein